MREDVKNIIENRPIWKKLNPVDPIKETQVPRVEEAIARMREKDPILTDLFSAYVIAKYQNDDQTADIVMQMIYEHKASHSAT